MSRRGKSPAVFVIALWGVPLLAFALLRVSRVPKVQRAESVARKESASPATPDGEVRSPSPAANVAALGTLPYILQKVDFNRASGVLVNQAGRVSPGLNFFFPWSWKPPQALLMSLDGTIVWRWSLAAYVQGQPHPWLENAALLPDGCVLFSLKDRGIVKVDRDSKVLWESPLRVHHDLWPCEDGSIVALSHALAVVPEIHPTLPIESDAVAFLSADGKLRREIRIVDLLRRSGYGYLLPRLQQAPIGPENRFLDVFHLNHVEPLDGSLAARSPIFRRGNLLISIRNLNAIGIVDPDAEKIVWLWGPGNLTFQHHSRMLPDGNILLFDNGTARSQVIELEPLSLRVTWRYAPAQDFFSALAGAVQRLPNGNTLITESMAGHALEVTPAGETVWRYSNPEVTPKGLRNGIIRMIRVAPETLTFLPRPVSVAEQRAPAR